jgi:hypothetical protein
VGEKSALDRFLEIEVTNEGVLFEGIKISDGMILEVVFEKGKFDNPKIDALVLVQTSL